MKSVGTLHCVRGTVKWANAVTDSCDWCQEEAAVRERAKGNRTAAATSIDEQYGLEPVIDLATEQQGDLLESFVELSCPYCGEPVLVRTDVSAGAQSYVEDCQVCCQPMLLSVSCGEGVNDVVVVAERM
jgi:predicted RNA-binding Zn-ribbon protein involved in translation (DUF1610 family)